jgi:transposase InsO family protein
MEVSRSGYYKWRNRKGILNRYQVDQETAKGLILEIRKKHETFGYRSFANHIRNNTGWLISDYFIHRVCKRNGIRSQARKPKWEKPGSDNLKFPNIINGNWSTTRPFEKVVTDTTIIKNKYITLEWTLFIDVFNNEIISYCLSAYRGGHNFKGHMTALERFLEEKIKRGYTSVETILHSDQGTVYASRAFQNAHKDYNIKRSMSRAKTPTDNPIIEALNGWMKNELYIDFDLENTKDIPKVIAEYVKYFNHERLSYRLKYKTPIQVKTELGFI